jgi:release factor glutamine methyltransferase
MKNQDATWDKLFSHERQELSFGDATIFVENGVFTPDEKITYSASMIIDNLPSLTGLRVADIGTGSGVLAVVSALRGAKEVVATDISEAAVKNAIENTNLNKVTERVRVLKANLFDGIDGRFDLICANLPILEEVWKSHGIRVESTIELFLKEAKLFLNPNGKIYLPWASFGDKIQLESLLEKYAYTFELLNAEKLGYIWYMYILSDHI